MTRAATTRWWRPRTLRHQLVLGVSAVVTVVVLVVGIASVVSLRTYVNTLNDAEVDESLDALTHSLTRYQHGESGHRGDLEHAEVGDDQVHDGGAGQRHCSGAAAARGRLAAWISV